MTDYAIGDADKRRLLEEMVLRVKSGKLVPPPASRKQFEPYFDDPYGYITEYLKIRLTPDQERVVRLVPTTSRLLCKASHGVGKTFMMAALALWHFDCRTPLDPKQGSKVITTAPTQHQVKDLLWGELRKFAGSREGLLPADTRLRGLDEQHFVLGFTARTPDAFQGFHARYLFMIFDECVGIAAPFWVAAEGILTGPENLWAGICNPTDISSQAYLADTSPGSGWHVETISALDHPNIHGALAWRERHGDLVGYEDPYPGAVSLGWVEKRIEEWCMPISAEDAEAGDIEWPPQSGIWYRPGPNFESRVIGRWPSSSVDTVWSDAYWQGTVRREPLPLPDCPPEIGCDPARFGDDNTTIHVRRGGVSLHHEWHQGWDSARVTGRLKQLASEYAFAAGMDSGERILVKIDNTGDLGSGLLDHKEGYRFRSIKSTHTARDPKKYPNRRSELWFTAMQMARRGELDLTRLSPDARERLRQQLLTPRWKIDAQGRNVVEPKDQTKVRLKMSPDDADGFNLAYAEAGPEAEAFTVSRPEANLFGEYEAGDWRRQLIREYDRW